MAKRKRSSSRLEDKTASVTLRDLADDLDYWTTQVSQFGLPGTEELHKKAVEGIQSLAEVIRGYAEAGFRIDSGKEN